MEDLLGEDPALIRLELRPWKGPFDHAPGGPFSTMEIELEEGDAASVAFRMWIDPTVTPSEEARLLAIKVGAAWIEESALRFVERVLARG
ncbi:MAG: hypothetical protein AB7T31_09550 [Gemmatimonadales bacterium]